MSELEARIHQLEERLQVTEDQLAIHNLIVRYGLAVDLGDAQGVADVFTSDAEFEVGSGASPVDGQTIVFKGHEELKKNLVLGEKHQSLLPDCAHTIGPVIIDVDGHHARATGYSRIYHRENKGREGDHIELFRIGFNHWELEKQPNGRWLVARRVSRVMGDEAAHDVFRRGLQ